MTVAGRIDDAGFQQCQVVGQELARSQKDVTLEVVGMVECDWTQYIDDKGRELKFTDHADRALVYYNGVNYVGGLDDFLEFAAKQYEYEDLTDAAVYEERAVAEYNNHLLGTGSQFVFMDVQQDGEAPERIVLELYTELAPKTCENFRQLCTGEKGDVPTDDGKKVKLDYLGSPFHRVVQGGWVQGGDIVEGHGDGGYSIFGECFPDECFAVKHDGPGVLFMCNCGGPHTNASQFGIALRRLETLNEKFVAFGRVVSGMDAIQRLGETETDNDRPIVPTIVSFCHEFVPGDELVGLHDVDAKAAAIPKRKTG